MGPTTVKRRKISESSATRTKNSNTYSPNEEEDKSSDVFRKFFESQFKPLDLPKKTRTTAVAATQTSDLLDEDDDDESGEDEEFEGFSNNGSENDEEEDDDEEEDEEEVMVVEHVDIPKEDLILDKHTRKAILSARISSSKEPPSSANKTKDEEVDNEADNLQNDLALQRLLKESHLLESGSSNLDPTGKNRHKALDLRLQALGAKKSIFEQKNMPKSHREGINAKAIKTESNRRRDAKENGIILEKPVFKQQSQKRRRERGVGAPAVGKFSGGTLRLNRHDLASIQGPSRKGGRGSKRGRRR